MRKWYFSLRAKLLLTALLVVAAVGGAGLYQVHSIHYVDGLFGDLIGNTYERRDLLDELKISSVTIENNILNYNQALKDGEKVSASDAKTTLATQKAQFDNLLSNYRRLLAREPNHRVPLRSVDIISQHADQLLQTANKLVDDPVTGKGASQQASDRASLTTAGTQLTNNVDDLTKTEDEDIALQNALVDSSVTRLIRITYGLTGAVALFSLVTSVVATEQLARSFNRLRQAAARLANGDFSTPVPVDSNDEFGQLAQAFNSMSNRLRDSYQRLAVESERDNQLLESLGEGVIAIDEKTNVALINPPAIRMLELAERDKVAGLPVNHIMTLYDQQDKPLGANDTPGVAALQSSQAKTDVYGFRRGDKTKVLLNVSANPVIVNGKVAGAVMTIRDVTKEKEIDRMKTEFISLASHQLRTPLSAIKWFTEMLVSGDAGELQPDQLDFAKNIADSTERMIALVNALLNISRIESGRIMVDPKPTDLQELVSGIVNDLKGKTAEKQQSLVISVHQDLPKINLDPRLIGQVYLNLLTNAIKYTPKGGEISVFISKKDDQVISQVTDNGYGIPKEQQTRIFQKFFRASNAVKVETDGTGLGLYLIKAVIESSGGKIWFKSDEGKGTTFWFSIPLSGMKRKEGEVTLDV